jgi:hypothetical protein
MTRRGSLRAACDEIVVHREKGVKKSKMGKYNRQGRFFLGKIPEKFGQKVKSI